MPRRLMPLIKAQRKVRRNFLFMDLIDITITPITQNSGAITYAKAVADYGESQLTDAHSNNG